MIEIGQIVWWRDGSGIVRDFTVDGIVTYIHVEKLDGTIVQIPASKIYQFFDDGK